ncbi:WD40 repeat-like protein [Gonapodya prolifera JEL478]|uniref:WD40 repeat-like protein n=1 Tax=Gonapodya prolifera (strain JEL478) TaxID=1344416 RepID=A0A139AU50_GONPJ|nr:WD40 repeat-like protein [Gonapodya prolifera JEL478]|eukprot:KXS20237.1 WD40 repeat-like protein [Gonapodya prolifera JEL478]
MDAGSNVRGGGSGGAGGRGTRFRIPTQRELWGGQAPQEGGSGRAAVGAGGNGSFRGRGGAGGGGRGRTQVSHSSHLRGTFPLPLPPPRVLSHLHPPPLSHRAAFPAHAPNNPARSTLLSDSPAIIPQSTSPNTVPLSLSCLLSLRTLGASPLASPGTQTSATSQIAARVTRQAGASRWRNMVPRPVQFARVHARAVHAMDWEKVEWRYLLTASADPSIAIWDCSPTTLDPERGQGATGTSGRGNSVTLPRNGAAAGTSQSSTAPTTRLYPLTTTPPSSHSAAITSVLWWPVDTGMFLSSGMDGWVKAWDTEEIRVVRGWEVGERCWSCDVGGGAGEGGMPVVAVALPTCIRLLDLRTPTPVHTLLGHTAPVHTVSWSPRTSHVLASGGADGSVRLWDVRKGRACVAVLDRRDEDGWAGAPGDPAARAQGGAHDGTVNGLVWWDDGSRLVSTGTDECVRLWDVRRVEAGVELVHEQGIGVGDGRPAKRARVAKGQRKSQERTLVAAGPRPLPTNYGPHVRNVHPFPVRPYLTPSAVSDPVLLFMPQDDGEVLVFDAARGGVKGRVRGHWGGRCNVVVGRGGGGGLGEVVTGGQDGGLVWWATLEDENGDEGPAVDVEALRQDSWSSDDEDQADP